jgi:hypothetical protein
MNQEHDEERSQASKQFLGSYIKDKGEIIIQSSCIIIERFSDSGSQPSVNSMFECVVLNLRIGVQGRRIVFNFESDLR